MAIVVRYNPSDLNRAGYDRVNELLAEETGLSDAELPDGLLVHVLFGNEGSLKVSEIWETEEQFRAFRPSLVSALEKAGVAVDPDGPDVFEVHNLVEKATIQATP
jgi:hypothetical protein